MTIQEQEELTRLIGEISLAWSALEHDLTEFLSAILANKDQPRVVAAIFHASTNIEVKLTMIDESFKIIAPSLRHGQAVSQEWARLLRRIGKQKATRNAAIHGTFIGTPKGIRLAPPTFSPKFWRQATHEKFQIGVSAHEIQQAIRSIHDIRNSVMHIVNLIWFSREGKTKAYAERLQKLLGPSRTIPPPKTQFP